MCTVGMDNSIINKPMHKSSLSITETNWFSWDIYLSCRTILAWLSQAEKHGNHRLKSSNHKNNRLKTVKLSAKGRSQKTGRASAALTVLVSHYFVGCWFLHWFALGEVEGEQGWRRAVDTFFWKSFAQPADLSTYVVRCVSGHLKQCHCSSPFCGEWAASGTGPRARQGCSSTVREWKLNQVLIRDNCLGRTSPAWAEPRYVALKICNLMRSCFKGSSNNSELQRFITFTIISVHLNKNLNSLVLQETAGLTYLISILWRGS